MNPPALPDGIEPGQIARVLEAVHAEVATALWLSAGMLCAFAAIVCGAFGWHRTALAWGFLYSLSLCFVHNGQAQILGPLGCAAALAGLLRPRRRRSA